MKRTLILSATVLILIIISLSYFLYFRPNRIEIEQKVSAQTQTEKQTSTHLISAPGVVEPISEEIEVGTEIAGKIRQVLVEEGDQITKGQTIAILENADFQAQIASAKTQIETLRSQQETADAKLSQANAERTRIFNGARPEERREALQTYEQTLPIIEQLQREVSRRRKLYDSGDISREEFERSKRDLETAQKQSLATRENYNVVNASARKDDLQKADAAIRLAEAQIREFDALIREAEARVRTAEANLSKTIVRAPMSGVVLRKRLKDGESVSPENQTGIITVADISVLRVRVDVDETDVSKIKIGQTGYITAETFGTQKFSVKVVKIGQILGRKNFRTEKPQEKVDTKILEVLLEFNKGQNLPVGLRVDAFISTGN